MDQNGKKVVVLFPGQGVAAKGVIEYYKFLRDIDRVGIEKYAGILQDCLDEVNPQAKFNASEILNEETSNSWNKTSFVQPLTYILSIFSYELLAKKENSDLKPVYMMGHSFGAFSALTASGALPLSSGVKIVAARGKFMQDESEKENKGMCAVIGLTEDKINEICEKTGSVIALKNAPEAFVVGCSRDDFAKVEEEAVRLGGAKTIRLPTSGAFHTKFMQGAYQNFKVFLRQYSFDKPQVKIVTNMVGEASDNAETLKNDVVESMINCVNWIRMMNYVNAAGVDRFIECGPGTSLSSLSRMNGVDKEKIIHAKTLLE